MQIVFLCVGLLIGLMLRPFPTSAAPPATLEKIRSWSHDGYTRVVLDLDRPVAYDLSFRAASIAISLTNTTPSARLLEAPSAVSDRVIESVELDLQPNHPLVVLITPRHQNPYKIFTLENPDRVVIDILTVPETVPKKQKKKVEKKVDRKKKIKTEKKKESVPVASASAIRTIVIDPGHGGHDPGAIGASGLAEKEVVLDVSRRLQTLIRRRLKKKVVLTRDTDVFIPLGQRAALANRRGADLFISVHVNAAADTDLRGVEIYLFGRPTNAAAGALAARENAEDDKTMRDFEKVILDDMQRDFRLNAALTLAHLTQSAFASGIVPKYRTASLGVKHAPFYVLAKTEMPAILAEIAFVSHPAEETRLARPSYRQEIAEALFAGVADYIASPEAGGGP